MDIGKRLKQLRIKNDLTLEDLASRCELTKGFLSQLEHNSTSPSISTLESITEVLGISLEDFFKEEKESKFVFKKDDFYEDEREDSKITWLIPNSQKNMLDPILLELQENGESQTISPFNGEEFGMVLQGKIEIVNPLTQKHYRVKRGETFCLRGNFTHYLVNKGEGVARVLWIATPSIF